MGGDLYHRYEADADVDQADIRAELEAIESDDISKSSPITAGVPEAGIALVHENGDTSVLIRVEGHSGSWSKTSETALRRAVQRADGVHEQVDASGGYQPDDE